MPVPCTETGLPFQLPAVPEQAALGVPLYRIVEVGLGDVLGPERVAGKEDRLGVLARLGTDMDRHRAWNPIRCAAATAFELLQSPGQGGNSSSRRFEQVLEFCARDPIERVFLEDVARRGFDRFLGVEDGAARSSRSAIWARTSFPPATAAGRSPRPPRAARSKMIIGDERAVGELWRGRRAAAEPRADRPGQPVYAIADPPARRARAGSGRRRSTISSCSSRSAPPRTRASSASTRSRRDPDAFRWRTRAQIAEGRSWLWVEDGIVAVQGRGLGLDAGRGSGAAGLG